MFQRGDIVRSKIPGHDNNEEWEVCLRSRYEESTEAVYLVRPVAGVLHKELVFEFELERVE